MQTEHQDPKIFGALKEIFNLGKCVGRFVLFSNGHNTYGVGDGGSNKPEERSFYGGYHTGGPREASAGDIGEFLRETLNDDAQLGIILKFLENNEKLERGVAHVLHKKIVLQKPINKQKQYHELIGAGVGHGD